MTDGSVDAAAVEADVEIVNEKGLHARASAAFATMAEKYDAEIVVSRDSITVNATSTLGLLMLAASKGCSISLTARGPDAEAAVAALTSLVSARFNEAR